MMSADEMSADEICDAVHGIAMMVMVLLDAQGSMQAPDADRSIFQMPREDGEMVSFAAFDIHKRVTALREGLNRPGATIVRIGGNECA